MKLNTQLLIIDPQNDFCDPPVAWYGSDPLTGQAIAPSLPVPGAHADMLRLAGWLNSACAALTGVVVTLDSHHRVDIAHPAFWSDASGSAVAPFTTITAKQVRDGAYVTRDPAARQRALAYLDSLENEGRYQLMVWPVHCEIGAWGHNIHAALRQACNRWEEAHLRTVQHVFKGRNPWTEHYSALQAEVPDPADPDTQLNRSLIAALDQADLILIAGEASSHCVKATTEHLVDHLPSGRLNKVVLLTDCMSPVAGFESQAAGFLSDMQSRGVQLMTADAALALLKSEA